MSARNRQESLYLPDPEIEVNSLDGIITIASHPFAPPTSNEQLVHQAISLGLPIADAPAAQKLIDATGFTTRYWSNSPEDEQNIPAALERTAKIGAKLLRTVMAQQGWDDLDVFVDTSAILPTAINHMVLEAAGLNADRISTRSLRYACAGFLSALIDLEAAKCFQKARVVIGAMEPLSLLVERSQFTSLDTIAIPAIFGDDYAFAAVDFDRFRIHHKKIRVQPDGNTIKLKTLYRPDQAAETNSPIPDYYEFLNGGREIFTYGPNGAFVHIDDPVCGQNASIDGPNTGLFFGDETADVGQVLLTEMGDLNFIRNLHGYNFVRHPASKPVDQRIIKRMFLGKLLDTREPDFIMGQIKRSNSSSASIAINLQNRIRLGLIRPQAQFFFAAPGIGSAIAVAAGEFT